MKTIRLPNREDVDISQYVNKVEKAKEENGEIVVAIADSTGSRICLKINSENAENERDVVDALEMLYTTLKSVNNSQSDKVRFLMETYAIFYEVPSIKVKGYVGEGENNEKIPVRKRHKEYEKQLTEEIEVIILALIMLAMIAILFITNN